MGAAAAPRLGGGVWVGGGAAGVGGVAKGDGGTVGGKVAVTRAGVLVTTTSATVVTSTTWVMTMGSLWHAAANKSAKLSVSKKSLIRFIIKHPLG